MKIPPISVVLVFHDFTANSSCRRGREREREKVKVTEINQDKEYHKQEGSYSNSWTCKCILASEKKFISRSHNLLNGTNKVFMSDCDTPQCLEREREREREREKGKEKK